MNISKALIRGQRFAAILFCAAVSSAQAAVTLPHIFGDHMVLQREKPIPVWGWAETGEEVTVTLGDAKAVAKADEKGDWEVKLPAAKAGGPFIV